MNNIQNSDINTEISYKVTPKDIVQNHLNSFLENNLEALMSDFTNESVLITPEASYTGLDQIRGFYANLIPHFPKKKSTVVLEKTVINGDLAYIVWNGKSSTLEVTFATDTFLIKKGKINKQTFAGQIKFLE